MDLCYLMGEVATTAVVLHAVDLRLPYNRKPLLPVPEPAAPRINMGEISLAWRRRSVRVQFLL